LEVLGLRLLDVLISLTMSAHLERQAASDARLL
jgi:hypothetical protein